MTVHVFLEHQDVQIVQTVIMTLPLFAMMVHVV
jgi:hypothetical protein